MVFKSLLDQWKIFTLRKIFVLSENLHSCRKSAVVENLYTSRKPPHSWKSLSGIQISCFICGRFYKY